MQAFDTLFHAALEAGHEGDAAHAVAYQLFFAQLEVIEATKAAMPDPDALDAIIAEHIKEHGPDEVTIEITP
jgi:hypothetical protein